MNKSIARILSLLVTSVTVGCGSSDSNSPGAAGSSGAGDSSAGDSSSKAGAGDSSAGDSSTGDTGNTSDAGSPGDSGGSSSGGSDSGGSSSGGTAGAPNPTDADCKKLETCCVGLPGGADGGPMGACSHIAGLNYGPSCVSTYKLYSCDSVIATENQPKSSACRFGTTCTRAAYNAASAGICTGAEMGTASENCPADGVTGCCKLTGVTELCSYTGDSSPVTEDDCKSENGTFSTTP